MRVVLEAIAGPHIKKRIVLAGHEKGTFGRTEWADYPFPDDPLMSSTHFSVEVVGGKCVVRDLGSTNGTYVDEERIVEREVVTGSMIRAGQTKVKVTLDMTQAAPRVRVPPAIKAPPANVVETKVDLDQSGTAPPRPAAEIPAPRSPSTSAPLSHQQALADADPLVRRNALLAAAWTGCRWVLDSCRSFSVPPALENWEALLLLAILGRPSDLARILTIGRAAELGSWRWQVLGAFGHPQVVNDLIAGIESTDAAAVVAAGAAFTKITGVDLTTGAETAGAPKQSGSAESEPVSPEAVELPSAKIAQREWQKLKNKFLSGERWAGGLEVSKGLPEGALEKLDLESRFEACLRGRYEGTWRASRFDLEQLANKLSS